MVSIGGQNEVLKLFVTSSADRPGNISKNPDLANLIQVDRTWLHISWEKNVMMFFFSLISYILFAFCFWGAFFLRVWFACWCTTFHSFYFYFPIKLPLLLCRCTVYPLWMFLSCWRHIIVLWIWEFFPSNIWIYEIYLRLVGYGWIWVRRYGRMLFWCHLKVLMILLHYLRDEGCGPGQGPGYAWRQCPEVWWYPRIHRTSRGGWQKKIAEKRLDVSTPEGIFETKYSVIKAAAHTETSGAQFTITIRISDLPYKNTLEQSW